MGDPDPIKQTLAELAAKLGLEHPLEGARIFARWDEIVGPEVARRCKPSTLKQGVLTVTTDSAAWASELRYLGPELARRLNADLGADLVREVKAAVSIKGSSDPVVRGRHGGGRESPGPPSEEQRLRARSAPREGLAEVVEKARLAAKMGRGKGPGVVESRDAREAFQRASDPRPEASSRQPDE